MASFGQTTAPVDRAKVTALSKMLLRDSAELPMQVTVTTSVMDASGKEKRHQTSTVQFVFHGYNQQAQRFSFNTRSGWFNTGALRDSEPGDFAVFEAFSAMVPSKQNESRMKIAAEDGGGFRIDMPAMTDCRDFEMNPGALYPHKFCPSVQLQVSVDAAGAPSLERFGMDVGNLPAVGRIAYLGAVEVRRIHAEGNTQQALLPGDPQPFFVPKAVVTTIETDKGRVVLSNLYKLSAVRLRKK